MNTALTLPAYEAARGAALAADRLYAEALLRVEDTSLAYTDAAGAEKLARAVYEAASALLHAARTAHYAASAT